MEFINLPGDTLALTDEATISYIAVEADIFLFDKKFLRRVSGKEVAQLAKHQKVKLIEPGTGIYRLITSCYFGNAYHHFLPAYKKNLLKMTTGKQKETEAYLIMNQVAFRKENDLKKLIDYLQKTSK